MTYVDAVKAAAANLGLLDADGKLTSLDSLSVLDLITEIERSTSIAIPTADIRADVFESVDSVAAVLTRLALEQ